MTWGNMAYIRDFYKSQKYKRGAIVFYKGERGKITSSKNGYLWIRIESIDVSVLAHPKDIIFEDEARFYENT